MKKGETKVIDQREQSTMTSTWDEYLVLEKLNDREFRLDIRGWGYLGEVSDFDFKEDEHGELIVPEEINGQYIESVEDGSVYGGELAKREDEQGDVRFARPDQDEVISWLKDVEWYEVEVVKILAEECSV
jgi:hypothetical protein